MKLLIAIIQMVLHYLSLVGIFLGVIAYIFGNSTRGYDLLVGGISLMILKYVIGFIYLGLKRLFFKI